MLLALGANGAILLVLLPVCVAVFLGTVLGLAHGVMIVQEKPWRRKRKGLLLIVVCLFIPTACCNAPGLLFHLRHGRPPLEESPSGVVSEGMSAAEVLALLGDPHDVSEQDGKLLWTYYIGSLGGGLFVVYFGPDGRVTMAGGD